MYFIDLPFILTEVFGQRCTKKSWQLKIFFLINYILLDKPSFNIKIIISINP
jgi:hypothetical protein